MNFRYLLGAAISIPLLPLLYFQGKRIRASVPKLGEAKIPEGIVLKATKPTINLLFIGESTIAGVGVSTHEEGFCGSLAKEFAEAAQVEIKWKVYAKSGYTAERVHQKLVPKIQEKQADIIIVGLGGNDAFTLNTPARWQRDISTLIETLQNEFPKTPIFFTNMPPIKEFPAFTYSIKFVIGNLVEILGDTLTKTVASKHLVFYNAEKITIKSWTKKWKVNGTKNDFFSDGVHPSKLTYQIWAKDMANFIAQSGIIKNGIIQKEL